MFVLFKKEKSNRITIRLMIYAISLTGFISFHAWGEFYPVIVSIKTRIESATTATYFFQQGVANIGPISEQIMLPEGWYIALAHRHDGFPGGEDIVVPEVYMQGKKRSIGEAARDLYNQQGSGITKIYHSGKGNGGECIGYVGVENISTPHKWMEAISPVGTCMYVPSGDEWCKIETPELVFDHGVISLRESEGHKATKRLAINCTAGTTLRLYIPGGINSLLFAGKGTSTFSTSQGQLGKPMQLPAGRSNIDITSELHGVGIGKWSTSGVMIVEPV